jgi:hypothetical protein
MFAGKKTLFTMPIQIQRGIDAKMGKFYCTFVHFLIPAQLCLTFGIIYLTACLPALAQHRKNYCFSYLPTEITKFRFIQKVSNTQRRLQAKCEPPI